MDCCGHAKVAPIVHLCPRGGGGATTRAERGTQAARQGAYTPVGDGGELQAWKGAEESDS